MVPAETYIRKNEAIIVTGKAKEKIFRVGADRVITPIDTWIKRRTTAKGNIIMAAMFHMNPADSIPDTKIHSVCGTEPIGKNA